MYCPKPIDTSEVKLPDEMLALTEKIAENVHDVWAKGRISEGWTYGEVKDPAQKTTPLLVPMQNCRRVKRHTTATPHSKHSA